MPFQLFGLANVTVKAFDSESLEIVGERCLSTYNFNSHSRTALPPVLDIVHLFTTMVSAITVCSICYRACYVGLTAMFCITLLYTLLRYGWLLPPYMHKHQDLFQMCSCTDPKYLARILEACLCNNAVFCLCERRHQSQYSPAQGSTTHHTQCLPCKKHPEYISAWGWFSRCILN